MPIVFFDIAGPDGAGLKNFYAGVFGWSDRRKARRRRRLDRRVAAARSVRIRRRRFFTSASPISTPTLEQITQAGGAVDVPRMVVPGVVTFALFRDPAGNRMGLVETPA
jgi:predicted enzyme related to lactoylglutathione lyase